MPNLPAPYVSPWKEFARNLLALWADLGLRGRELWRRNREGDLFIPGFWPDELAAWFWPAVVALVLAALVSAGVLLRGSSRQQASPPPPSPVAIRELPAPDPIPVEEPVVILPEPEPTPPPLRIDPLLELFLDGSAPEDLLLAAQPDAGNNRLLIRLAESWWELPEARRQELAQAWLDRCTEQGYGELRLLNRDDQLIGRSARVGSGMILFNTPA